MSLHAVRPKILGFISEDASAWLIASLALAAGALVTSLLAVGASELYQRQLRQRFELLANERFSRIEERFEDQTQRLDGLRRFFSYSNDVTRHEYDGYAGPLLLRTQAYSWLPRVTDAGRQAFEQKARDDGIDDFVIRELAADGSLVPAARRDEYYPVLFTQSQTRLRLPLGFDVNSQGLRHDTLMRALATGGLSVTAPINLVGVSERNSRGVLMVAPVPGKDHGPPLGFVSAVISMGQLMGDGLPAQSDDNLHVRMLDLSTAGTHEVLYESSNTPAPEALTASHLLHLADRDYQLDISPSPLFAEANHTSPVNVMVILGALLSLMLSALLYSLVSQRQRALRLVEQRTTQLRSSEQALRITHNQLRGVLNAATQVAIIATDLHGLITTFNAGAERMLGYSTDEAVGHLTLQNLHLSEELVARACTLSAYYERDIALSQAMLVETPGEGGDQAREWTLVRRDGSTVVVNMLATTVLDEQGRWIGHLAICIDITERKRVHEALAARDQLLRKLSAEVPGGIYQFRLDPDGHTSFSWASDGIRDIYEMEPSELRDDGRVVMQRIHPDDGERVLESIRYSAVHQTPWREEYRVLLPRQGLRWVRGEATPEPMPGGGTLWHGYLTDITDLKRVEEELRALSVTDVLTGIHNRRYFQERLKAELDRSERDHLDLAVIMLDIDHFKRINDQFGHAVGDHVLQGICEKISHRLRRTDVFCRLGGEEFMVLCPGSNVEQAHALALELWQGLRHAPVEGVGTVTASFGVAGWRRGEGADALLLRADSGVYAAKQGGRDRVEPELP
ncbi:CHASE domain/sensory box-containing nucleotide cyclase [Pseudomonas sp. M47T1]|uniref:sensor domain-containing diguanylate cyclase n=1 Tax=unclassified Pseudomonas TaxID=196821 RepID=UPI0002607D62|nr:diguanylate cyclase [Pseudomonas sp. M47T1]EIK96755.1 CHASE domain/sensory box-containing nucleotide cyclase [Pseudomonas sp. M47T1]